MQDTKTLNRYSAGKKVAMLGIVMNIILLVIKLTAGSLSGSQAMMADGFNSVGDVFASFVALAGSYYASRPKDSDHFWGHGKAEYIASMIIGFSMIAIAVFMIYSSGAALAAGEKTEFSWWLIGVAIITIIIKAGLFIYCMGIGKRYDSLLIKANAYDHRNDLFVTSGMLLAILCSRLGVYWLDGVAGIVISVWIAYTGYTILRDASKVLMDSNTSVEALHDYENHVMSISGIDHIDSIVAKPVGVKYILIIKISVDRDMSVLEGHEIAKRIEVEIMDKHNMEIEDVIVHVNPDLPHGETE